MHEKQYNIMDKVLYRDIDIKNRKKTNYITGYIIHIQKDGSFIVGNVFVPHNQISQCLADNKHELNHVSVITKMDLKENADIAGI